MDRSKPLLGKNVLITRTKLQAASFAAQIKESGGNPIEIPLIVTQAPEDTTPLDRAIQQIDSFDWIVFTSTNGVDFFLQALREHSYDPEILGRKKIAVVGKKTALHLEERNIPVHIQPEEFIAEAVLEELYKTVLPSEKILFPKGNLARDLIEKGLAERNFDILSVVAYETITNQNAKDTLNNYLKNKAIDIVTFTSPSTIHAFMELTKTDVPKDLYQNILFACIGPISERALRKYISNTIIVAKEYTTEGLLKEIIDNL